LLSKKNKQDVKTLIEKYRNRLDFEIQKDFSLIEDIHIQITKYLANLQYWSKASSMICVLSFSIALIFMISKLPTIAFCFASSGAIIVIGIIIPFFHTKYKLQKKIKEYEKISIRISCSPLNSGHKIELQKIMRVMDERNDKMKKMKFWSKK
jgi:hypothetical protein